MTNLIVESLGGGWQSSALLLMSCRGELPKLDAAIFADTQNEMPETYEYLDYLREHADAAGIPLITVTKGNLEQDIYAKAHKGSQPTPPLRLRKPDGELSRVNSYTCSYDYKRRVVTAEVKRLCGKPGEWKRSNVQQWIGYTRDEMSRMKPDLECRCGHAKTPTTSKRTGRPRGHLDGCRECRCDGWRPWRTNRWPLITELGMTRNDCARWLTSHGYRLPPRSACWHCPNRGNSHWRDLRDNKPDLWERSCALDDFVRHDLNLLKLPGFIHQSGVALRDADLRSRVQQRAEDEGQEPLFSEETDMDCDAGVCFT